MKKIKEFILPIFLSLLCLVLLTSIFLCVKTNIFAEAETENKLNLSYNHGDSTHERNPHYHANPINREVSGDIIIPASYEGLSVYIESMAFEKCIYITGVSIFCSRIGGSAFSSCANLKTVTLGNNVSVVDHEAFRTCSSLKTVYYEGTHEEWNKVYKGRPPFPDDTQIICVADDMPNKIKTEIEDKGQTSDNVQVMYEGYKTEGYYSKSENGYPTSSATAFNNETIFKEEGFYRVEARSAFSESSVYYFTIDRTAPKIEAYSEFTNKSVTVTARDKYSGVATWEYRLNSCEVQRQDSESLTIDGGAESNGVWAFRAIDATGNATAWQTLNYVYRERFGNSEQIYNSFSVASYYIVKLPQKNFPSCYGSYTFADYDGALSFAVKKEWEFRVIPLDGGASWNYVSATNENTRQIYTSIDELNAVIDKYARKNIGDRKIVGQNGSVLDNPTDENGVSRADALVAQITELPEILSEYTNYRFMLAPHNFAMTTPERIVSGNNSTATIRFLSDGFTLRDGAETALDYGVAIKSVATEQGWYLITERDICGNVEKYLIYIDMEQPEVYSQVTLGNGATENVVFNQKYIDENISAMRFTVLQIQGLVDNADDFVMLSIVGRGIDARFVCGDALPILSYENGYYGAYTLTVYDRSRNAVECTVYIAGESPTLKHTSLNSEKQCTFTVQMNDIYNGIVDIKLFKVNYDESEERLFADSYGTEVCAETLEYKLTVGGKYVFEFTDLYGRIVRTEPLFYKKGLPTATFKGVKEGGITKNDVSVIFLNDVTAELYAYKNGEWVISEYGDLSEGASDKTLKILAGVETTAVYKVLLYVTADRNLFTEYTFEIDGIPPEVTILSESGSVIPADAVTRENFLITWLESGYTAFYGRQGALSESAYVKNTLIKTQGTYVFTVYDEVKNMISFTVTLDNTVSYTLEGNYSINEDNAYISRTGFVFTVTEPWSEFKVQSSNGISIGNAQRIDADGTYIVNVGDMYGNVLTLTLIVDKLPPEVVIETANGETLTNGARTREAFRVLSAEENVTITYVTGGGVYDGRLIDVEGEHAFRLADCVGNVSTVTVIIDRNLQYRVDGTYIYDNGAYYSRLWIQVVTLEEMALFEIEGDDGKIYQSTEKIKEEGEYTVRLCDLAGNTADLRLIIDKTAPTVQFVTESGKNLDAGSMTNEAFKLVCEELNVTVKYSHNGGVRGTYGGEWLTEDGKYVFTITDFLGTSQELSVSINRTIAFKVLGTYVNDVNGDYVSKNWLAVSVEEEMQIFSIVAEDGSEFGANTRITDEGIYEVYIQDVIGNTISFNLIIDKTAPKIELEGVVGNGATNGDVTIKLQGYSSAYYRLNGGNQVPFKDGAIVAEEGSYVITALDVAGNVATVAFEIDKHVDVTPSISLSSYQIITGAVSFKFGEDVTANLYRNGVQSAYYRGEIATVGEYELRVEDVCGNNVNYIWTIIPARSKSCELTAPAGYRVFAELNGNYADVVVDTGRIALTEDGNYTLKFESDEVSWWLELEIDNAPPTVEFENTGKSVKIYNPSKKNVTYALYRDGEQCSFAFNTSAEITKTGSYRLICTDDIGNVTEYTFELHYLGTTSIVLIVAVAVLIVVGITVIIVMRFKRKIM